MRLAMRFARAWGHKFSSDGFDAALGQYACWSASILILGLGFLKLSSLTLSETELFFGLLLVLAVGLLGVTLGMLVRIENNARQQKRD
jgi:hypothetical protein